MGRKDRSIKSLINYKIRPIELKYELYIIRPLHNNN